MFLLLITLLPYFILVVLEFKLLLIFIFILDISYINTCNIIISYII